MFLRPTPLFAAAGLCWTVAHGVLPDQGTAAAGRYRHISAARGREQLAAALFAVAAGLLVAACLAAARHFRDGRGARLTTIGTTMSGIGSLWLAAGLGAFDLEAYQLTDPQVPQPVALRLLDGEGGIGALPYELTLLCLLLGPLLLALGLWRAGRSTVVPVGLWLVGVVAYGVCEFQLKLGAVVGLVLATAALTLIGRALEVSGPVTSSEAIGSDHARSGAPQTVGTVGSASRP